MTSKAHLVLLGLPGAGKSTVGPLVAAAMGRPFVDLDAEIETRSGRTIAELFATEGEAGFRARERSLTAELLRAGAPPLVMAPGGGWVEDPSHREGFGGSICAVYLRVSPAVAVARMGAGIGTRPLLGGSDPGRILSELLARREALYLQSDHTVSTDSMSPAEIATSIVALASGR